MVHYMYITTTLALLLKGGSSDLWVANIYPAFQKTGHESSKCLNETVYQEILDVLRMLAVVSPLRLGLQTRGVMTVTD
jgi:hypothetical protein